LIFEELKAIQREHGYIPAEELAALAGRIDVPISRLHGVASFYPHFHLAPPARAEVKVCGDMSCHLRGACELKASLERRYAGASPEDVSIRDASCLGRCDAAPAISINDRIYSGVSEIEADALVRLAMAGRRREWLGDRIALRIRMRARKNTAACARWRARAIGMARWRR
jgi:formate dehydrogenase beta subunit